MKVVRIFALTIAPIVGFLTIYFFGVNCLFWDEFEFVDLVINPFPSIESLFRQHNEHRIVFPGLIYYLIAKNTSFSSVAMMYVSYCFVTILYICIIFTYRKILEEKIYIFSIVIGIILYHTSQYENILWGFQIGFYMAWFFSCMSFLCLQLYFKDINSRHKNIYFASTTVCALIASYSSAQGLFSWMVIILSIYAVERLSIIKRLYFLFLLIVGCIVVFIYMYGYVKPINHPSLLEVVKHPAEFINYFLTIFGGPAKIMGFVKIQGFIVTSIGILCIYNFINNKKNIFATCLILYSFAVCCSIAIGRCGFGSEQALASRYCTFSLCLYLGIILYCFQNCKYSNISKYLIIFLVLLLIICLPSWFVSAYKDYDQKTRNAYIAYNFDQYRDQLNVLYPDKEEAFRRLAILKKYNYNVFSNSSVKKSIK